MQSRSGVDLRTVEIVGVLHDERLARRHVITHEQAEDVAGLFGVLHADTAQHAGARIPWWYRPAGRRPSHPNPCNAGCLVVADVLFYQARRVCLPTHHRNTCRCRSPLCVPVNAIRCSGGTAAYMTVFDKRPHVPVEQRPAAGCGCARRRHRHRSS